MVTIYIWPGTGVLGMSENVGHAAMICGSTYISWWPGNGSVTRGDALLQLVLPRETTVSGASVTYDTDVASEGNRLPQVFELEREFSEQKILQAWDRWQVIGTYNIMGRSCCSCVLSMLLAGGLESILPNYQQYIFIMPPLILIHPYPPPGISEYRLVTPNRLIDLVRAVRASNYLEQMTAIRSGFIRPTASMIQIPREIEEQVATNGKLPGPLGQRFI